jgi:hypothetical protein
MRTIRPIVATARRAACAGPASLRLAAEAQPFGFLVLARAVGGA